MLQPLSQLGELTYRRHPRERVGFLRPNLIRQRELPYPVCVVIIPAQALSESPPTRLSITRFMTAMRLEPVYVKVTGSTTPNSQEPLIRHCQTKGSKRQKYHLPALKFELNRDGNDRWYLFLNHPLPVVNYYEKTIRSFNPRKPIHGGRLH